MKLRIRNFPPMTCAIRHSARRCEHAILCTVVDTSDGLKYQLWEESTTGGKDYFSDQTEVIHVGSPTGSKLDY